MAEYEQALADQEDETPDETFNIYVDGYDYDEIYYNDNSALHFLEYNIPRVYTLNVSWGMEKS